LGDSYERGGKPRSVPDPDGKAYDEMIRRHRATTALKEAGGASSPASPLPHTLIDSVASGVAHLLNGPREARREFEQGHRVRAMIDAATAAADITWGGLAAAGLKKGHVKLRGPFTWRTKPWEDSRGAREWMGDKGIVEKGQHAHHALIPNNGWGKSIPDAIKNQPANIKPMDSALTHTRIHSASRRAGLPRFNPLERYWHGTPTWWKAANGAAVGHATQTVAGHLPGYSAAAPPRHGSDRQIK
jgi:hypothetical protein